MLFSVKEMREIIGDRRIIDVKKIESVERLCDDKYILKISDGSTAVIEGHSDSVDWLDCADGRIVLECGRNNPTPTYVAGRDEDIDDLRKFRDRLDVYKSLKMVRIQRWGRSPLFVVVPVDVDLEDERDYNRANRSANVLYASTDEYFTRKFLARYGDFEFKKSPEGATIITEELFETFKDHEYPFFIDEPVYKIGDRLIYENYTCLSGYAGTCRCINHPRKEWRDSNNKIIFKL